jgi:hypothetical protein
MSYECSDEGTHHMHHKKIASEIAEKIANVNESSSSFDPGICASLTRLYGVRFPPIFI